MNEIVSGVIERVTFHNPENGFAVLKVHVRGKIGLVTVIGNLPSPTSLPSTSIKELPGVINGLGNDEETTIILKKETLPSTGTLPPTGLEIVPGNNGITTKVPEIKSGVPQSIIPPFVNK